MVDENNLTVLLCTDYLPPSDGGVEKVVEKLTDYLSSNSIDVHVFSLVSANDSEPSLPEEVIVHLSSNIDLRRFLGVQSKISPWAVTNLYSVIQRIEPDILHLHNRFFFTTITGYLVGRASRFDGKLVTTVHLGEIDGITGFSGGLSSLYERSLSKMVVGNSDEIVAVSDAAANHAISLGADTSKTHVVPNGVDSDKFRPPMKCRNLKRILYVGRMVENKGPQDLLPALPGVFDQHPDVEAVFIGTGPLRSGLKEQSRELGISDKVTFQSRVSDMSVCMREASIFCRPSYTEGLPLTLLEAMASETVPVVTPVAGVPEVVVNGENGVLVPTKDTSTLTNSLNILFNNQEMIDEMGWKARNYVIENHSWASRSKRILDIYRS